MTKTTIAKWGNSAAIRLPKAVMDELGLKTGKAVDLRVEDGRAIIAPISPKKITLAWILSEMDRLGPANEPETVDWGRDVGSERFYDED